MINAYGDYAFPDPAPSAPAPSAAPPAPSPLRIGALSYTRQTIAAYRDDDRGAFFGVWDVETLRDMRPDFDEGQRAGERAYYPEDRR